MPDSKQNLFFTDLGRKSYSECWALQEASLQESIRLKLEGRQNPAIRAPHHLFFTEHFPPVFTLGKSGDVSHLLAAQEFLQKQGIEFFRTNRGGDITFHGEGQLVGYPVLDLDQIYTDIHRYLRDLEEVIIRTLADVGIPDAGRKEGLTGVWVGEEKLCAIGVRTSRWVTMHGFALNVNTDLRFFDFIVPCGIRDKAVGSMERILGRKCDMEQVKKKPADPFLRSFFHADSIE